MTPADRFEIEDLLKKFYRRVDQGRADETIGLFTPDARLVFGPGAPHVGMVEGDAIAESMRARAQVPNVVTRHVLTNYAFEATNDGEISVYSLLTLYRHDGPLGEGEFPDTHPASVADVHEKVVKTDAGWRIRERIVNPVFNRPVRPA